MIDAIPFWLHIVAATIWVGPQFFLFVAAVPAIRLIEDRRVRLNVLRMVTVRFGWLAWAALLVLILSGLSNTYDLILDDDFPIFFDFDFRFAWIFVAKMALLGLAVLLTAIHSFLLGPRQLRLQEDAIAAGQDNPQAAGLRRLSMLVSGLILLASLGILFAAVLLAEHDFSARPV